VVLMPAKKLRVEVFDTEGNRYTVSCEGHLSKDKMLHLLDLVELLGAPAAENGEWRRTSYDYSKFDKVCALVKESFPIGWFSSKDTQRVCEREFNAPFSLSTVSTYLARMADRGFLIRKGPSNCRRYKILEVPYGSQENVVKDNE
jgi:hypothetical protein